MRQFYWSNPNMGNRRRGSLFSLGAAMRRGSIDNLATRWAVKKLFRFPNKLNPTVSARCKRVQVRVLWKKWKVRPINTYFIFTFLSPSLIAPSLCTNNSATTYYRIQSVINHRLLPQQAKQGNGFRLQTWIQTTTRQGADRVRFDRRRYHHTIIPQGAVSQCPIKSIEGCKCLWFWVIQGRPNWQAVSYSCL